MWDEITRLQYRREGLRYASDTTDEERALIERFMPPPSLGRGRSRTTSMRAVADAIFYLAQTGCQWRMLPKDFPPFTTVQCYFYPWRDAELWRTINHPFAAPAREAEGREPSPTAGIIDSQSVKTTEAGGPRGPQGEPVEPRCGQEGEGPQAPQTWTYNGASQRSGPPTIGMSACLGAPVFEVASVEKYQTIKRSRLIFPLPKILPNTSILWRKLYSRPAPRILPSPIPMIPHGLPTAILAPTSLSLDDSTKHMWIAQMTASIASCASRSGSVESSLVSGDAAGCRPTPAGCCSAPILAICRRGPVRANPAPWSSSARSSPSTGSPCASAAAVLPHRDAPPDDSATARRSAGAGASRLDA